MLVLTNFAVGWHLEQADTVLAFTEFLLEL
jgi:hypothetical protein